MDLKDFEETFGGYIVGLLFLCFLAFVFYFAFTSAEKEKEREYELNKMNRNIKILILHNGEFKNGK